MHGDLTRHAVLFDFGGVLTTSLVDAFERFGTSICGDAHLPLRVLAMDAEASALLVEHEKGRLNDEGFEVGFAQRLAVHGAPCDSLGLLRRIQTELKPDRESIRLVDDLRQEGYKLALVSNSLGRDCYAGFNLDELFDEVIISAQVGIRKPSRGIYAEACKRLEILPAEAVMVDDLEQNLVGAGRLGLAGILHTSASETREKLKRVLGTDGKSDYMVHMPPSIVDSEKVEGSYDTGS